VSGNPVPKPYSQLRPIAIHFSGPLRNSRFWVQGLALSLVVLFCLGSATTQQAQQEEPVEWLIYLDENNESKPNNCKNGAAVTLDRGSLPMDGQRIVRFRLEASRPQPLEQFEAQLLGTAKAWCMPRVNLLRAEMVEGEFLAERVWAATWEPLRTAN
jgi:hypothetical protein